MKTEEETKSHLQPSEITSAQDLSLLVLAPYMRPCICGLVSWGVRHWPFYLSSMIPEWAAVAVKWLGHQEIIVLTLLALGVPDIPPTKVNLCQQVPHVSLVTTHTEYLSMSRISGGRHCLAEPRVEEENACPQCLSVPRGNGFGWKQSSIPKITSSHSHCKKSTLKKMLSGKRIPKYLFHRKYPPCSICKGKAHTSTWQVF